METEEIVKAFGVLLQEVSLINEAEGMSGAEKKQWVLDHLELRLGGDEVVWEERKEWLSLLIDFLVAVGKHRVAFDLLKRGKLKRFLLCCGKTK